MSEEATAPKKRRRRTAQAAPLPITATVVLKGKKAHLTIQCFSAQKTMNGWMFVSPSASEGRVKTTHVNDTEICYVELEKWPDPPQNMTIRWEQPGVNQGQFSGAPLSVYSTAEAQGAAVAVKKGPQTYANPYRTGEAEQAPLPPQGRSEAPFRPITLGSFSSEPFGVPDGAAVPTS